MARARKKSTSSKSSRFSGVFIGLILGLGAALAVAVFVTKAPLPFVDRFGQDSKMPSLPPVGQAPDPNQSLYGQATRPVAPDTVAPDATLPPVSSSTEPPVPGTPSQADTDELNKLIANLPPPIATPAPPQATPAPKAPTLTYYLQAGAFRQLKDAEAMAARLLMLGLDSTVQQADVNGSSVHRVRLGPFNGLDAMNQVRSKLSDEKIDTSVIRP